MSLRCLVVSQQQAAAFLTDDRSMDDQLIDALDRHQRPASARVPSLSTPLPRPIARLFFDQFLIRLIL
jgi:hypothetical protein